MCYGFRVAGYRLRVAGFKKAWLLIRDWGFPTSDYQAIR